ncbi:MAG: TetR/AcrR family transcriptional regulator [Chitinophagales bacterium]|nr:TetR/AcrR family transcriptional regulator [Chitinophagales bacterium]
MPKPKVSETFILDQALKIFSEKSYHNATMADIAEACGLLKGSMYHYYDSKEELMKAVIEYVHAYFNTEIFAHAYQEGLSTSEKLRKMGEKTEQMFIGDGCIMGNIGIETARVIPEFSELIRKFFDDWVEALTHVFKAKYSEATAREVAEQCVAEIEGSVMMMRIYNQPRYLKDALRRVKKRIGY